MRSIGTGDREKVNRRPVMQNLRVCDFYDKETHMCLADGTSICFDPNFIKEENCETAREATNAVTKNKVIYHFPRTDVQ